MQITPQLFKKFEEYNHKTNKYEQWLVVYWHQSPVKDIHVFAKKVHSNLPYAWWEYK